jgi:hypothetical protein
MGIADLLTVNITVAGASPQGSGFGEPLIASYHTHYTDLVREYTSLTGMVSDGFSTHDPAYVAASSVFAQNPAPSAVKIGRRAFALTQTLQVVAASASASDVYQMFVALPGGPKVAVGGNVTLPSGKVVVGVQSTGTPATDGPTLATALNTAIATLETTARSHATASGATITLAATTAGLLLDFYPDRAHTTFSDVTTDAAGHLTTDLNAILAADSGWYGLLLDSQSVTEISEAAAWTQSAGKLFVWNNSDDQNKVLPASDSASAFALTMANSDARSPGLHAETQLLCYSAAAWMGVLFTTVAGSENWAFKTLLGVPVDTIADGYIHNIENKNGSVYTRVLGVALTQFGKTPDGEWIDIIRGRDSLVNALQVQIVALQANTLKVPYTDAGISQFYSIIDSTLKQFVSIGFLAANPAYTITVPKVAQIPSTNRAGRTIPAGYITFQAQLAGAINNLSISGTLTA